MSDAQETVTITLRFANRRERDIFMCRLSDAWGWNACDLKPEEGKTFAESDAFNVTLFPYELRWARRQDLIDIKYDRGLTPEEEAELKDIEEYPDGHDED